MDSHRAFAFLATQGAEGASPHVASDILSLLRARGHPHARLTSVGFSPLALKIVLDPDTSVIVRQGSPSDNAPGQLWFFVTKDGTSMVRVNAGRVVEAPYAFADEEATVIPPSRLFTSDWRTAWPTKDEARAFATTDPTPGYQRYASRVHDAPVTPVQYVHYVFVSERAIVDAVELVLRHTP